MRGLVVTIAIAGCGSSNPTTTDGAITDGPGTDVPPDPCEPETWCIEESPVSGVLLQGVWAANLDAVFAVGDAGTILRRSNNTWTKMDAPTTANLRGVWGTSASDVWAAGEGGALLHYDGTSWTARGNLTVDLGGIWAAAPDDVWFTAFGAAIHYDGSQFATSTLAGAVFAISGSGPDDVWATGENANVAHFTGTWDDVDPGAGSTYFAILALAPTDVWVATFAPNKQTLHFDGSWTPYGTGGAIFQGFHAVSSSDIWAAGGNKVGHWTGTAWDVEAPVDNTVQLFGIGGIGSSFWSVGTGATIVHRR